MNLVFVKYYIFLVLKPQFYNSKHTKVGFLSKSKERQRSSKNCLFKMWTIKIFCCESNVRKSQIQRSGPIMARGEKANKKPQIGMKEQKIRN